MMASDGEVGFSQVFGVGRNSSALTPGGLPFIVLIFQAYKVRCGHISFVLEGENPSTEASLLTKLADKHGDRSAATLKPRINVQH